MDSKVPLAERQTQPDNGKAVGSNPTRHHSLETAQRNNLDIGVSDSSNISLMPLMRAQMQAEWELAHRFPPWKDGTPTEPGFYLVRGAIDVFSDWRESYRVTIERWDGENWTTLGSYVIPDGWMDLPPV